MHTGNQQEQTQGTGIQQTEYQCRRIALAPEQAVGHEARQDRAHNAAHRADGDNEAGIERVVTLLRLQIEHAPTVYGITANIHKGACQCQYPNGRHQQDLFLCPVVVRRLCLGQFFLLFRLADGRQSLALWRVMEKVPYN